MERLGHGYLGRLVRLPYDNLVGGKVAVLGSELGNERPLVLVGVRRACGHRRVVRCINDHVVGVVVVRGVVVALVLEAERADRQPVCCGSQGRYSRRYKARIVSAPIRPPLCWRFSCRPRPTRSGSKCLHLRL